MKYFRNLRNQAMAFVRGFGRAAAPGIAPAANRSLYGRMRARLRFGDEGGALVEFAIVLPILLTVTTGTLIFGLTVNQYICLTEATASGARFESVQRGQTTNPCFDVYTQVKNGAPTLNAASMTFTMTIKSAGATPTTLATEGPSVGSAFTCSATSTNTPPASYLQQGGEVLVEVQYPCNLNSFKLTFASCNLQSEIAEMVQ